MMKTVALVLLLDQFTKFFISQSLYPGRSVPVIKDIFHITLVLNTGAAFGIFPNATLFFIIISMVAIVIIFISLASSSNSPSPKGSSTPLGFGGLSAETLVKADKLPPAPKRIYLSLILAGAIGNLIDRLKFGYVVDFLDFRIWPVFNIADSAITIGTILLAYSVLVKSRKIN